jgi:hypothetical protein
LGVDEVALQLKTGLSCEAVVGVSTIHPSVKENEELASYGVLLGLAARVKVKVVGYDLERIAVELGGSLESLLYPSYTEKTVDFLRSHEEGFESWTVRKVSHAKGVRKALEGGDIGENVWNRKIGEEDLVREYVEEWEDDDDSEKCDDSDSEEDDSETVEGEDDPDYEEENTEDLLSGSGSESDEVEGGNAFMFTRLGMLMLIKKEGDYNFECESC